MEKLQIHDSSLFIGQSYSLNDGAHFYLIFQTLYCSLKRLDDAEKVVSWKSKDFSAKKRTTAITTDDFLSPSIKCYENSNFCLVFK